MAKTTKMHNAAFAKGGRDHTFDQQVSSTKKSGIAGKVDARGPGQKFASGGRAPSRFEPSVTARAGRTSPVGKKPRP
jgi:hypothetical protein